MLRQLGPEVEEDSEKGGDYNHFLVIFVLAACDTGYSGVMVRRRSLSTGGLVSAMLRFVTHLLLPEISNLVEP